MKKQLLIAAVAATMGTAAIADVSITGNMKVNYTNEDANGATTDSVSHETNLAIVGKSGDTTVHMEMAMDDAANRKDNVEQATVVLEDVHLTTTIGAVKVKTGTWNGSDTILAADSTRTSGNWILSTDMQGVSVALEGDTQASATSTAISGDIAGVAAKYKMKHTSDELYLSADVAGVAVTFAGISADAANSDAAAFTLAKEFNGVTVSYSDVDADSSYTVTGDTAAFGDAAALAMAAGDDASAIKLSTSMAGNTVSARFVSVDALIANSDFDVNTFTVTRPLAGGSTLEVTYTDTDKTGATNDTEVLDVELAVKF
jgi:hypothetical protein